GGGGDRGAAGAHHPGDGHDALVVGDDGQSGRERDALALNDEHTGLLAVDAANVVGREIGQPLHVYDADRVTGPLRVRLSDEGEPADLLDSDEPVPLPAGLTVVADDEGVVAVAGVMGTRRTAVTATTRRLLVESGLFDPVAVRRAARALRRQTAAATRFERGAHPGLGPGRGRRRARTGWRRPSGGAGPARPGVRRPGR
ncbi:B3/B4 domain-containing protein, partial [Streptomyces griseolus]|uniref:B3/B4 domain-containing protein n=1 Tax=Streptomyces griseolus TaxID=1909 RepID=UPI0022432969